MTVRTGLPAGTAVTRLLCAKGVEAASGIVRAHRGKLKRLFCLMHGRLVWAGSNVIEEQIVEHLAGMGLLDRARADEVVRTAAERGCSPGSILLTLDAPREDILSGAEDLVLTLLAATVDWPEGSFEFEPGTPRLDGEPMVDLTPVAATPAVARVHPPSAGALRARVAPRSARPTRTQRSPELLEHADLGPAAAHLLALCDGTRDVLSLVRSSPEPENATLRILLGLELVGAIDPNPSAESAPRAADDAPLTRDQCLKQLAVSAGDDHYTVLGLGRECTARQIRDAYYALARRYHPDRFRSGDLQDLLDRFEEFFSRVTSAYNTLGDVERRREYDLSLAARVAEGQGARPSETAFLARQNYVRGRTLASQRRLAEALTFLENAVKLDGTQADYHRELGNLLAQNPRRREDAERHLLLAAEMSPAHAATYVALGVLYQRAGLSGMAAAMLREALRWDPTHLEASRALSAAGAAAETPPEGPFLKPILKS